MKRDILKYAEAGQNRISDNYKLNLAEAMYLKGMVQNNDAINALRIAFNAGCEAGARATIKRMSAKRAVARG